MTLNEEYRGEISKIYIDKENHAVYTFDVQFGVYKGRVIAGDYPGAVQYAVSGDSIIKKKGDLFIKIKKRDGESQIFELNIR